MSLLGGRGGRRGLKWLLAFLSDWVAQDIPPEVENYRRRKKLARGMEGLLRMALRGTKLEMYSATLSAWLEIEVWSSSAYGR